jgi:hypothetical protein
MDLKEFVVEKIRNFLWKHKNLSITIGIILLLIAIFGN